MTRPIPDMHFLTDSEPETSCVEVLCMAGALVFVLACVLIGAVLALVSLLT